jgi:hypothetical protein
VAINWLIWRWIAGITYNSTGSIGADLIGTLRYWCWVSAESENAKARDPQGIAIADLMQTLSLG